MIKIILLTAAIVAFTLDAIGVSVGKIELIPLGLALFCANFLIKERTN